MEDSAAERDVLVLAKTIAADQFPVERPAVLGVDRESGRLERLSPFPWKNTDTDPPILRWSWIHLRTAPAERDPRPESRNVEGEIVATAYLDPKDAWRLRWPFVRPHLRGSLEALGELAREGVSTIGFIRPKPTADILQLPLRLRFGCDSDECNTVHELPVLDWELHEMARISRERYGAQWATKFRETWGRGLFEKYDVHLLLSSYAQSPAKFYVAGLFYPPKAPEDAHQHAHHLAHREHANGEEERPG
ncbi:MAG TPA: hypothetical protein VM070_09155 [Candidatus Saccharimonadales bacterium]|nr:hypothetical protein [Candidatus Saccharimonadales bacterium]